VAAMDQEDRISVTPQLVLQVNAGIDRGSLHDVKL
jgi:hypothetical protein